MDVPAKDPSSSQGVMLRLRRVSSAESWGMAPTAPEQCGPQPLPSGLWWRLVAWCFVPDCIIRVTLELRRQWGTRKLICKVVLLLGTPRRPAPSSGTPSRAGSPSYLKFSTRGIARLHQLQHTSLLLVQQPVSLRSSRISAPYPPCTVRAATPSGVRGPVLAPPCIRHLPFGIAAPSQGVPAVWVIACAEGAVAALWWGTLIKAD
jgi:hypothetical protein